MMIGKRRDRWLALALLLACGGLARAQDAALAKDAELLAKPESNATVVANLKAAAPLTVLDRKGGCCLLYTSPSPRDRTRSRMPSSA